MINTAMESVLFNLLYAGQDHLRHPVNRRRHDRIRRNTALVKRIPAGQQIIFLRGDNNAVSRLIGDMVQDVALPILRFF